MTAKNKKHDSFPKTKSFLEKIKSAFEKIKQKFKNAWDKIKKNGEMCCQQIVG